MFSLKICDPFKVLYPDKFKNVGLIDTSKPIFINNHKFIHSLVYTGSKPRGVLLAYGIR